MARSTATRQVRCWKEHECSACGSAYRYLFHRERKGIGLTPQAAAKQATESALRALRDDVERRPCPVCGFYQPDMVGRWRERWHFVVFLSAAGLFAVLVLMAVGGVPKNIMVWLFAALAGLALVLHLLIAIRPFNSNPDANRRKAERLIERGEMALTLGNLDQPEELRDPSWQRGALALLALMVLGLLVMPTAELVRWQQGWVWNSAWHPEVAGPGDATYTWFPDTINTVAYLWQGQAQARALNAAELGLPNEHVLAETNDATWGETISVDSRTNANSIVKLWARIVVPDVPDPAGKTLRSEMRLDISYPAPVANNKYEIKAGTFTHTEALILAPPRAGLIYRLLWWTTSLLGAVFVVGAGVVLFMLARRLARQAPDTKIIPLSDLGEVATLEDLVTAPGQGGQSAEDDIAILARRVRRVRLWFIAFVVLMPVGCAGPMCLFALIPNSTARTVFGVTAAVLSIIGFGGSILFGSDFFSARGQLRDAKAEAERPRKRRS